jgi:hypothetical protein
MAVVLAIDVVALALSAYLSTRPTSLGAALRYCLLVPAILIFICIAITFSGLLSPDWSLAVGIAAIISVATFAELIAVVAAVLRLIRMSTLRTRGNVMTVVVGSLSLVPGVGIFLLAVITKYRYAG